MKSLISSIIEKYVNPQLIFQGKRFTVMKVDEKVRDKTVQREVVSHPGAVAVLPFLDENHIILIKNKRFAVGQTLLELPAGTLEPDEEIETCAYRELREETGYEAKTMIPLLHFFPSPGFCNEVLYCFIAKDLKHVGQHLDSTEQIEVEVLSLQEAFSLVKQNKIVDAKTLIALLSYQLN